MTASLSTEARIEALEEQLAEVSELLKRIKGHLDKERLARRSCRKR